LNARPTGPLRTTADLWAAYLADRQGRAVLATMAHTAKHLLPHFGALSPDEIHPATCRAYVAARRRAGIADTTINTELGHLATVLNWAAKARIIPAAPHIERPPRRTAETPRLTRAQAYRLIEACTDPHLRLATILLLTTSARVGALVALTWGRVDLDRRLITLTDPDDMTRRKSRATIPINDTAFAALTEAAAIRRSDHVIEWGGRPVRSIRKGLASAATRAGLPHVSPHMLRHSAATWMAEAGIGMEEIAAFLGHATPATTRRLYARFSPDYLRKPAAALELPALRDHSHQKPLRNPGPDND
jgi:integrase